MELIGKTTINPVLFYSGKISGYIIWILMLLRLWGAMALEKSSVIFSGYVSPVLLLTGIIIISVSLVNLGSSTRLGLPAEKTELKSNGLYRLSRNPMYFGFNLLTLSSVIFFLNIIIICMGIYSIAVYHLIILGEERFMRDRFGHAYIEYQKKVRRYI